MPACRQTSALQAQTHPQLTTPPLCRRCPERKLMTPSCSVFMFHVDLPEIKLQSALLLQRASGVRFNTPQPPISFLQRDCNIRSVLAPSRRQVLCLEWAADGRNERGKIKGLQGSDKQLTSYTEPHTTHHKVFVLRKGTRCLTSTETTRYARDGLAT